MSERKTDSSIPSEDIRALQGDKAKLESALFEFQSISESRADYSAVLEEIARAGMEVLKADAAGVYVIDHVQQEFVFETIIGGGGSQLKSTRMALNQGVPGLVAATGQPQIILRDGGDVPPPVNTDFRPRSILCVPMFEGSKMIGVLGFYDKKEVRGFTSEDIATATAFASVASKVLHQSLMNHKLRNAIDSHDDEASDIGISITKARKLTSLVKEIGLAGEREYRLSVSILEALRDFISRDRILMPTPEKILGFSEPFTQEHCKNVPLTLPRGVITREWAFGSDGKGIRVAVIDTGVDDTHPAVGPIQGYADTASTEDGLTISTNKHDDLYGHGTACAGIIRKLAPECDIYSVRVLGQALFGTGSALLKGMQWAVENGCGVCNLSLGTTDKDFFADLHRIVDSAYFKNVVMVVAANNQPVPSFPAVFAGVISVASHSHDDEELLLYNDAPPAEFGAHGIDVRVAWLDREYVITTGNSYAAPHVSGFVARILGTHPNLTPPEVKTVLKAISNNCIS